MSHAISLETRLRPGTLLSPRELMCVSGERVRIPDSSRLLHLQFRRFAGCPICHLHLRSMVRRRDEIEAAGIREVVVFHSAADELRKYESDLPFSVIADPQKRLYLEFGVEPSPRALIDPRVWWPILRAVVHGMFEILRGRPVPPLRPDGGRLGLPADFLIDRSGRVLAAKYGAHADDQWSVDELLAAARPAHAFPDQVLAPAHGGESP